MQRFKVEQRWNLRKVRRAEVLGLRLVTSWGRAHHVTQLLCPEIWYLQYRCCAKSSVASLVRIFNDGQATQNQRSRLLYTTWSKVSGDVREILIRTLLWHTSKPWTLIPDGLTLCLYDTSNSSGDTFCRVSEYLQQNGSTFFLQSLSQSS
jgi:hypothetical protein